MATKSKSKKSATKSGKKTAQKASLKSRIGTVGDTGPRQKPDKQQVPAAGE